MKTKHYLIALATLSATAFTACKKDKDEPKLNAKEILLTAHDWKIKSITVPKKAGDGADSSITKDCSLKATIVFSKNRAFQAIDPDKNCDSTIVPYGKGNWNYSLTKDSLSITGTKKMTWKVTSLTDNELKAIFKDSLAPDKVLLKTVTLKK